MIRHMALLSLVSALALALVACKSGQQPVMPDMQPVGDGLSVLGYTILGSAVVLTLGRLIRL